MPKRISPVITVTIQGRWKWNRRDASCFDSERELRDYIKQEFAGCEPTTDWLTSVSRVTITGIPWAEIKALK